MRISTAYSQLSNVNALLEQQVKLAKTQQQLSTGLKQLKPSDDPIAAAKILEFNVEIDQLNQFQRNIDTVRERNVLEESSLQSAENVLFRAKELTIQAANGTLTSNDRLSIKSEVDQLLDNLLSIANTKNANGEYIFSGYLTDTKPFVWDTVLNAYDYQGTDNQRTIQVNESRRIADGDPGSSVFENITSVSQDASLKNNTRSIFNTLKALSNALTGSFSDPNAVIQGKQAVNTPLTLVAGTTVTLNNDLAAAPITINLAGTYNTIDDLVNVFNSDVALNGAGIKAQSNGQFLEFISTTQGAVSSISLTAISANFATETGFNAGDTGNGINLLPPITQPGQLFNTISDEILTDLDNALESFLQARSAVGSRLRTIDNQEEQHETFIFNLQTTLSEIQDLDYTEAISRFNLQNIVLQAAQQSFSRVQNLSLFNFL